MSVIDKLTPEQEALILVYREKWRAIALSTERIDKYTALIDVMRYTSNGQDAYTIGVSLFNLYLLTAKSAVKEQRQ